MTLYHHITQYQWEVTSATHIAQHGDGTHTAASSSRTTVRQISFAPRSLAVSNQLSVFISSGGANEEAGHRAVSHWQPLKVQGPKCWNMLRLFFCMCASWYCVGLGCTWAAANTARANRAIDFIPFGGLLPNTQNGSFDPFSSTTRSAQHPNLCELSGGR